MATVKDLEVQIEQLTALLAQHGIFPSASQEVTERMDYIPFGSERHLAFLGLTLVENPEEAKADGYTVLASRETGKVYRLADEMQAVQLMRPMDPDKAVTLVLRQKVQVFEAGAPPLPARAPQMFNPGRLPTDV